jgi:hypothetical protein
LPEAGEAAKRHEPDKKLQPARMKNDPMSFFSVGITFRLSRAPH